MATYVNDLRLKEIGTGESSGTWGTETNTNLELIGESLGYGTESITTNADTHASTVADGSTDPARSMYIKYTGTLDSACTITIGPNTMSRVHIIENATSGSQNIIIKQGSGAEVTIPNGFVKAVYLDGAGSGAAVIEAFTDLSLGSLLIDGATPTLTIGDAGAEDTKIVFDGNAQDFYIGLDDSADDLVFGKGSTLGTTQAMAIDENMDVAFGPTTNVTITNDGNEDTLTLVSTDADANVGPVLLLDRNSSSPADSDVVGSIDFDGRNDAGQSVEYAQIISQILDASDGTEDGALYLQTIVAGTKRERISLLETETVFNNASVDLDFRVESNGNANMLLVDAGTDTVIIGGGASENFLSESHELQVNDTNFSVASFATYRAGSDGATLSLGHSRNGTINSHTVLNSADIMGQLVFYGSDGTDFARGASIVAAVDGTPGNNDMPGRLVFSTTADGADSPTERLRISNNGGVGIGVTPTDGMDANIRYLHIGEQSIFRAGDTDYTDSTVMSTNVYQTGGTNKYITTGFTSSYTQQGGTHFWGTAPSGSANDTATEVEIFRANASGGVTVNNDQNSNINFIAKAGSSANALQVDGSSGAVTINEASADADFRVESDGNTHMLFVDAGNNRVGVGGAPTAFPFEVSGATLANGSARRNFVVMDSTSAGSGLGGGIGFGGFYSGTSSLINDFASIQGFKENATDNDYAGALRFTTRTNGNTPSERMRINSNGAILCNATASSYIHDKGMRIVTNEVGSHLLDGALNIQGSGGDFYAQNWTGPSNVGFGLLAVFSATTDYLLYQYRSSSTTVSILQLFQNGDLTVHGALSKGSGSFKIDHPLPAKKDTHNLVHSFIEGPQADLIYRGSVDLVEGSATVNLDTAGRMTEGTFVLLNTNTQCFTTNESGWTAVKGSVSGNILTITAQDNTCTDTISWMVVGERCDQHMKDTSWTDADGRVITEPEKEKVGIGE